MSKSLSLHQALSNHYWRKVGLVSFYAIYVNLHRSKVVTHLDDCGHVQQNNTPPEIRAI